MLCREQGADSSTNAIEKLGLLLAVMLGVAACGTIEENLEREPVDSVDTQEDAGVNAPGDTREVEDVLPGVDVDGDASGSGGRDTTPREEDVCREFDVSYAELEQTTDCDFGYEVDVDEDCHFDCFGGQYCAGGVVSSEAHSPAPCWAEERFEGFGVCVVAQTQCASGQCGSLGAVCAEDQEWVWPGGSASDRRTSGNAEQRRIAGDDRLGLILSSSGDVPSAAPRFSVTLAHCESVPDIAPSTLGSWALCEATVERAEDAPFITPALLRTVYHGSYESIVLGSVTWWDGTQLVRVDWFKPQAGAYGWGVELIWREGVGAPLLDGVLPPGEGSGSGASEGSGASDGSAIP